MTNLDEAFALAKRHFPNTVYYSKSRWRLVEGMEVSGISDHQGKLVLQEKRPGCKSPFHHWGFYVMVKDLNND